jgi:hypothetical protein
MWFPLATTEESGVFRSGWKNRNGPYEVPLAWVIHGSGAKALVFVESLAAFQTRSGSGDDQ